MYIRQFFVKGLAHSSYMIAGARACAIVDPRRDTRIYIDAVNDLGVKITHVLLTHLHADFVSGHMDLAEKTGAAIYIPRSADARFEHVAVDGGSGFSIDDMLFEVYDTPGHTPEHVSYVVTDQTRGGQPAALFCGDTLFVGDVGRPDLFPDVAQEMAARLFDSLHEKIMRLPDDCMVYPAHGAGSLCGRAIGAMRYSTIGYERRNNPALQISDRREFVLSLTENMPPAPDHFSRCSEINRFGPELLNRMLPMLPLDPTRFRDLTLDEKTFVLDVRSYSEFCAQHVPGAYHIDVDGNFATFAGWILPPDMSIMLVAADRPQADRARKWLRRVGLDDVVCYLEGGMFEWAKAGLPTGHVCVLSAHEFDRMTRGRDALQVVDVRSAREFAKNHIGAALNIPAPDLRAQYRQLDPKLPTVLVCSTGHRSSMAASLLARRGFARLYHVAGGMTGYASAGFAGYCPRCVLPHGPRFPD